MFDIKPRIKVVSLGNLQHIVNGVAITRMNKPDFDSLRSYLRSVFENRLNRDIYKDDSGKSQPVYEYYASKDEIMNAIHEYNKDIELV